MSEFDSLLRHLSNSILYGATMNADSLLSKVYSYKEQKAIARKAVIDALNEMSKNLADEELRIESIVIETNVSTENCIAIVSADVVNYVGFRERYASEAIENIIAQIPLELIEGDAGQYTDRH